MAKQDALVLRVAIHAAPGAKRTEAAGTHGEALKVRLAAPPVDGKANQALQVWLALTFGLRQNAVELQSGQTSRAKLWALQCEDAAQLEHCKGVLKSLMNQGN